MCKKESGKGKMKKKLVRGCKTIYLEMVCTRNIVGVFRDEEMKERMVVVRKSDRYYGESSFKEIIIEYI